MERIVRRVVVAVLLFVPSFSLGLAAESDPQAFWVCISNERDGTVTILDGASRTTIGVIPVGKRPRGIHPSPDGLRLYVALSGSPILGPPTLDAQGNPVFQESDEEPDHSADGIGVVDLVARTFLTKLPAGSDPEEFAVSKDGSRLYISNEDVGTVSVLSIADAQVIGLVRVKQEPEGVALSPDGSRVYVTCETGGEIFVIDTANNKPVAEFTVGGRPRTVAFSPDGSRAYIPSETTGMLHVVDTSSQEIVHSITLPQGSRPMGTAMAADGKRLYVSTGRGGTVCVIDPVKAEVVSTIGVGKRPWGIAISPDGGLLFVANGPSNDISVVDLQAEKEIERIEAGQSPWGIAVVTAPQ